MALALVAGALCLPGCLASHGRVPGVDPNMLVIEMNDDEWMAFCTWREELRGTEPLEYHCAYPGREPIDDCDRPGTTPCYDWRATTCMGGGIRVVRPGYPATRTTCLATVEEFAACWETREERVCHYSLAGESPECDHFMERCPDP